MQVSVFHTVVYGYLHNRRVAIMMDKDSRMEAYRILTGCCQTIWNWKLDRDYHVLSSDCPHEALYKDLLFSDFWQEKIRQHTEQSLSPVICSIQPGLCWILAFDEDKSIYMKGPFFNRIIDENNFSLFHRNIHFSPEAVQVLEESFSAIPALSGSVISQFAHMLHFCVWGTPAGKEDMGHITQELQHNRYRGHVSANPFEKNSGGWEFEQELLDKVRHGDLSIQHSLARASVLGNRVYHPDKDSMNDYRQNIMVLLTLVSRAAVEGGLPQKISFSLCTEYRKKAELCTNAGELLTLNHDMVMDYVERVHKIRQTPGSSAAVRQCCEYITAHTDRQLNLKTLAQMTGYTETHLSRKFKREMGCTIVYYIQNTKVEKAKYLLINTHESVDSISNRLAFNTRSYFTQVFRQYTGITPSEYREKYGIV